MTIHSRLAIRDASLERLIAQTEDDARHAALFVRRNDLRAIKRACRRYLRSNLADINRSFKSLPEFVLEMEQRIDFRSTWERTPAIDLRGARLAALIMMRREREEMLVAEAAE